MAAAAPFLQRGNCLKRCAPAKPARHCHFQSAELLRDPRWLGKSRRSRCRSYLTLFIELSDFFFYQRHYPEFGQIDLADIDIHRCGHPAGRPLPNDMEFKNLEMFL